MSKQPIIHPGVPLYRIEDYKGERYVNYQELEDAVYHVGPERIKVRVWRNNQWENVDARMIENRRYRKAYGINKYSDCY